MEEIEKIKNENEHLKKLNENKANIISITAHQLRTSFSALKWTMKMLLDGDAGKLTDEQTDLIQKVNESNEKMLLLVNDLLSLSHRDDISISYNFKELDILKIIEETINEFCGETTKKQIKIIITKKQETFPCIKGDEEMIHIVLQNLIENAIKYSDNNNDVSISIEKEDNNINISIYNRGTIIKENDKENIFKKFFRSPNAIEKEPIGSGLGLFTTKNIIEKHNGKIWFENTNNEGTTFFVSLPIY